MASTSTENASSSFSPSSSSSITPRRRYEHDVFVSFRGLDTRKKFTSHLYAAFKRSGLTTFRDDENLERGASIDPALLRAIEESRFAVVIFSSDYASSSWCLTELAKIVECMDEEKLTVLPVFYDVDPSDVFNLKGTFEDAFAKHLNDNSGNIQKWKDAVTQVAVIAGWDLRDEHESTVIEKIIRRIRLELDRTFSGVSDHLVGMDSRVKEMLDSYLGEGLDVVRFVGICGMGGSGKTTLAREIYKRIAGDFEASSFIEDVRENTGRNGLVSLQKQLCEILMGTKTKISNFCEGINVLGNRLCNKKVLIVLDDVDGDNQLEALAGNHDWFGPGSRIIVTCRDRHLLSRRGVDPIYEAKGLNYDEALELFSWKAFKKPHPEENYVDLSKEFVKYADGLPLALKVLGSSLFGKGMDAFRCARDKLKAKLNPGILDVLEISFNGLDDLQRKMFLDIACFFKGHNADWTRDILASLRYPDYDIGVLVDKSLITIDSKRTLWMHDLLQELGREIVYRESPKEPGKRSRLWKYEDVMDVLKNNTGTERVVGIALELEGRYHSGAINYQMEAVEPREDRLVPVELNPEAFRGMKNLTLLKIENVHLPKGLNFLSDKLRWIEWKDYPLKSLPTDFRPLNLVQLEMRYNHIKRLWKGAVNLVCLKLIDVRDSQNLIETPDFTGTQNLEKLLFSGCTRLAKIHASLGDLKRLTLLDFNGCKCLECLPQKISLESLEIFDLGGCSRLKRFPEIVGNMPRLTKLFLNKTAIKKLPFSVKRLIGLIELDLSHCKNLSSLVDATCSLTSLKTLTLSGCLKLDQLPENLGNLKSLEKLHVNGTAIRGLPSSFVLLKNLIVLNLHKCQGLSTESLTPIGIECSLSGLWSLVKLDLSYCYLPAIPDIFGRFPFLGRLHLTGNNFVHLPKSFIRLTKVIELHLNGCMHLRSLPELPLNIQSIEANGCTSLETITLTPGNYFHPFLRFINCIKLIEYHGYGDMLLTMLRQYFQGENDINLIIPGSEIPIWFSHQSVGDSVNLQMPSHLRDKKLMGMAICAVFILRKHHLKKPVDHNCLQFLISGQMLNPGQYICQKFGKIESYHLFLRYLPLRCFDRIWKETLSQIDVNGRSQIEIKFSETEGPGLEFMKCGAHLVFEQDIEDLNHDFEDSAKDTKIKRRRDDYDKDGAGPSGEDSAKDTKIRRRRDDYDKDGAGPSGEDSAKDTKIKRRRDDYDNDGAGPSGEGTSNGVDVPHPKRIWFSNIIDKFIPCLGNWNRNGSTLGQGNFDCKEEQSL